MRSLAVDFVRDLSVKDCRDRFDRVAGQHEGKQQQRESENPRSCRETDVLLRLFLVEIWGAVCYNIPMLRKLNLRIRSAQHSL
jgi:hypothetical protein